MARFAWLHELAHAFNGHVDFVRREKMALRLCELPDPIHQPPASLIKRFSAEQRRANAQMFQWLEFDADRSALWGSVQMQLHEHENIQSIIDLAPITRMKLTLFGCYAMPWLFDQFQSYMQTKNETSHPEPLTRLASLLGVVRDRLLTDIPELAPLNRKVLDEFDHVRNRIPALYSAHQLITLSKPMNNTTRAQDEMEEIIARLKPHEYHCKK